MKQAPPESKGDTPRWEGKVYNAENGKLYDAKIRLLSPDQLELKGCVMGFICGGQTWTRYVDPAAAPPPSPPTGTAAPKPPAAPTAAPKAKTQPVAVPAKGVTPPPSSPTDPMVDLCSIPEIAGAPH